ncbi:ATP synthase regulation protein NCA2-domain-containing protein [Apodospora peruviana]|uniref:ATP synthase regulation protein NCA2-domain-containing protein n=1 Tax=Apodospora peruviana TaxID=516989 RepID=A0AAE0I521_9PEZI|nr:ATP synthase regulation protein NCA2-domain-containing protein [Apodospora peruviana]
MSIVADSVRSLDAKVDLVSNVSLTVRDQEDDEQRDGDVSLGALSSSSPRAIELLRLVRTLSNVSTSGERLQSARLEWLLLESGLADRALHPYETALSAQTEDPYLSDAEKQFENDVEWLLLGKATVQTYGLLMQSFLDQIIPLSDDIWYWDDVLDSYSYSCLYTVQSTPLRMWAWTTDIYHESLSRFQRLGRRVSGQDPDRADEADEEESDAVPMGTPAAGHMHSNAHELVPQQQPTLSIQWRQFYSIVKESIAERSLTDLRRRVLSTVDVCRSEARSKRAHLRRLRSLTATGLGMLMAEGLNFRHPDSRLGWRGVLERSVSLMDMVLQSIMSCRDLGISAFEDKVFEMVEQDPELSVSEDELNSTEKTSLLARRLLRIIQESLPSHAEQMAEVATENGRPPRLVRYWLPAVTLLVSSSTILRILVNRRDDIVNWIQNLGVTVRDFWLNWVVEPTRKIINTIRHDSSSEIAIMSRDSLKADRDSLERMVVDFARDKPEMAVGASTITDSQVADIRSKVREGDVTPILRAYEKDLRKPFVGAVRGDLVRALLIQIQKTKVDLEVAISGIDALLKSQELVFGFVGLTPGILVSIGFFQYLKAMFGSRKGIRRGKESRRSVRVLRKIDRILSEAIPTQEKHLSYKDHGLLVCEVHVLRTLSHGALPADVEKEFVEDLGDLANLKSIQIQMRTLDRIRWAYAEWVAKAK